MRYFALKYNAPDQRETLRDEWAISALDADQAWVEQRTAVTTDQKPISVYELATCRADWMPGLHSTSLSWKADGARLGNGGQPPILKPVLSLQCARLFHLPRRLCPIG